MQSLESVVVGVEFSPGSAGALRQAIRIATWNRAAVHAVHVIDTLVAEELGEALAAFQPNAREGLIADATRAWGVFASAIEGAAGVSMDVRIDHRVRGILAAAREARADLLVVGACGAREEGAGVGQVALSCARHAMSRVLLVRETQGEPFKTIVACVDFSPTSRSALSQAARVATQDGAALHVLHVYEAPWHQLHYRAPTPEAADPRFQKQYRDGLERRLREFAGGLGREIEYLAPTFALLEWRGHRSGIVEYAGKNGADLIVLGTRGRTNLRDVVMGSTAEKVLRESACSVLAVKPEGFEHPLAVAEPSHGGQRRTAF
ncbi:MAG TPA: universal stress protein [Phycisphaerales bacterium]|nr:universal stress protein [Phycisphaerales bacterium]